MPANDLARVLDVGAILGLADRASPPETGGAHPGPGFCGLPEEHV